MRAAQRAAQARAIRLHKAITDRAFRELKSRGVAVQYPTIMLRGAGPVMRAARLPLRSLGYSRQQLMMSGHLGDLADAVEQWEDSPDWEDWEEDDWTADQWQGGQEPLPQSDDWEEDDDLDPWGLQDEDKEAQEAEDNKKQGTTPGPVPIRVDNWNLEPDPAEYRIAYGDTLVGLAATYLHDGARWREIWEINQQVTNPDEIWVGKILRMPDEAVETLLAYTEKTNQKVKGETSKGVNWALVGGLAALAIAGAAFAYTAAS